MRVTGELECSPSCHSRGFRLGVRTGIVRMPNRYSQSRSQLAEKSGQNRRNAQ